MILGPPVGKSITTNTIIERVLEAMLAIAEDIKEKGRQGISVINLSFAFKQYFVPYAFQQRMRK